MSNGLLTWRYQQAPGAVCLNAHQQPEHPVLQVGGGTFALRGDLWVQHTFDINPGRDLTVRSGLPYHF